MVQDALTIELRNHLNKAGETLWSEYQDSKIYGKGTPQEVADFSEASFKKIIRCYYPYPYEINKGIIRDSFHQASDSIDSVIINPMHPKLVDDTGKLKIILADGVDVAIELKSTISDKVELHRGLEQIRSVKKLRRHKSPYFIKRNKSQDEIERSKEIPTFLYSMQGYKNIKTLTDNIEVYYIENQVPKDEYFDFVVVHNAGILSNYKSKESSPLTDLTTGQKLWGMHWEEWGNNTFAGFILRLTQVLPSQPAIAAPIIYHYLKQIQPDAWYDVEFEN